MIKDQANNELTSWWLSELALPNQVTNPRVWFALEIVHVDAWRSGISLPAPLSHSLVISLIKTQLQTSTLNICLLRMLLRSVSPIGQKGLLPFSYRRLSEQPGFCRRHRVWPYSLRHGTLSLRTRNEGFHTTLWRTEQSRHGSFKNS